MRTLSDNLLAKSGSDHGKTTKQQHETISILTCPPCFAHPQLSNTAYARIPSKLASSTTWIFSSVFGSNDGIYPTDKWLHGTNTVGIVRTVSDSDWAAHHQTGAVRTDFEHKMEVVTVKGDR